MNLTVIVTEYSLFVHQWKKMRFDLQKAVNTPVNTISPVSSDHLRDKLFRLRALLKGETVEVTGKRVNPQGAPQGVLFCKNLVARMIAVSDSGLFLLQSRLQIAAFFFCVPQFLCFFCVPQLYLWGSPLSVRFLSM